MPIDLGIIPAVAGALAAAGRSVQHTADLIQAPEEIDAACEGILSCQEKLAELISLRRQHAPLLDHPGHSPPETPSIDATIAKAWADLQAAKPLIERNKIRTRRRRQQQELRNGASECGRSGQASVVTHSGGGGSSSSSTAGDSGYFASTRHDDHQQLGSKEEGRRNRHQQQQQQEEEEDEEDEEKLTPGQNSLSPPSHHHGWAASPSGRPHNKKKIDLARRMRWKLLDRSQYHILEKKLEWNDKDVRDKIARIEQMVRLGPLEVLLEKTARDEEQKRAGEAEGLRRERDARGLALLEPPAPVAMKGAGTTTTTIVQVQVLQVQVGGGVAANGEGNDRVVEVVEEKKGREGTDKEVAVTSDIRGRRPAIGPRRDGMADLGILCKRSSTE